MVENSCSCPADLEELFQPAHDEIELDSPRPFLAIAFGHLATREIL
jgi:hypothetical protein